MAQCKWCERKGLFLRVDKNGLCKNCLPIILPDIQRRVQLINDSMSVIEHSRKFDTKLSRMELIISLAEELQEYEEKGIPSLTPHPSALLIQMQEEKNNLIMEEIEILIEQVNDKISVINNQTTKINHLSKTLIKIKEYQKHLSDPRRIDSYVKEILDRIHNLQLTNYLDLAKKAEFKKQYKKALDQYYEALYFLKNDDIDDSLQMNHIHFIEYKIAELNEKIKK